MILPARLPPPVRPGDRVGVAALSGPVDPEALELGLAQLRRLGFEPVLASNLTARAGLFAGTDAERLAAFHQLAADTSLGAIFFARGGAGLLRVLPDIDWTLLRRRPRAYVGYSDLTPFLLEVVRRLDLVAFHGPMVAADMARPLAAEEVESLLGNLAGEFPRTYPLELGPRCDAVSGVLLGGCLSLLASSLGTPWAPDLDGALVVLEDVQEPLYRIDRMLTQLHLSGSLTGIAGMVLGYFSWQGEEPEMVARSQLYDSCNFAGSWPLAGGLAIGHGTPNLTLPLGLNSRIDPLDSHLVVGEDTAS